MVGAFRFSSIARFVVAALVAAVVVGGSASLPGASVSALSRWTGGIDLYRTGVFTTQKTWLWCTAADVQIVRNIVDHAADHSSSSQQRYFDYMRARNRYAIPVSDGVDPAGWTAGLRHYVDSRYGLVVSRSFDAALRSAVTNLRRTNLPVAITVSHGNHAWVLTGFTATADPAVTTRFTVTSVRVVGPLWGLQTRSYGYDMRPDMKLTPAQLKGFFTPWHYARVRMAWEGGWVSVQPIAASAAASAAPKPASKPAAAAGAQPAANARPAAASAARVAPTPSAFSIPSEISTPSAGLKSSAAAAVAGIVEQSPSSVADSDIDAAAVSASGGPTTLVVLGVLAVLAGLVALAGLVRRNRSPG